MTARFVLVIGETPVTFDLIESPVVDAWRDILTRNSDINLVYTNKMLPGENIQDLSSRLTFLIDKLRNQFNFNLPSWSGVKEGSYNQSELNRLHEEFHRQEDALNRVEKQAVVTPEMKEYLEDLNIYIHKIEAAKRNRNAPDKFCVTTKLNIGDRKSTKVDMTQELRECFAPTPVTDQVGSNNVHIALGYHTVGKDIFSCFLDNDIELVRGGLVTPQRAIWSEFNIIAMPYFKVSEHKALQSKLNQWVRSNGLQEIIDTNAPENNYCIQPLLGHSDFNREALAELIRHNDITDYYFEETL